MDAHWRSVVLLCTGDAPPLYVPVHHGIAQLGLYGHRGDQARLDSNEPIGNDG